MCGSTDADAARRLVHRIHEGAGLRLVSPSIVSCGCGQPVRPVSPAAPRRVESSCELQAVGNVSGRPSPDRHRPSSCSRSARRPESAPSPHRRPEHPRRLRLRAQAAARSSATPPVRERREHVELGGRKQTIAIDSQREPHERAGFEEARRRQPGVSACRDNSDKIRIAGSPRSDTGTREDTARQPPGSIAHDPRTARNSTPISLSTTCAHWTRLTMLRVVPAEWGFEDNVPRGEPTGPALT